MILLIQGHDFAYEMENVARLFFPGEKLTVQAEGDPAAPGVITARQERRADGSRLLTATVGGDAMGGADTATTRLQPAATDADAEWALARLLFELLAARTGIRPPWGSLTGVRPVSLCRALLAEGRDRAGVRALLKERFLTADNKIELALDVLDREQPLLDQNTPDAFSLYISIPFCPSRCLYCSFVSHDIQGVAKLVPDYVRLLCEEIRLTGAIARRRGLRLRTVYMGGGTPTTLEPDALSAILGAVAESFDLTHLREYTVEAGRPDTITADKLDVLRRMGVDRISINPQTMNDAILREIGRDHTAGQIREGFALARKSGFSNINMDLIAGLPGESVESYTSTLDQVLAMGPENITVHTLTVKRSSRLREQGDAFAAALDVSALLDMGREKLARAGYNPYYLYRQKGTVQNLENVGYALPGTESLYNVLIMEEIQTILAVGAGAVTKVVGPGLPLRQGLRRIYNYKFPYEYISRFDGIRERKLTVERLLSE